MRPHLAVCTPWPCVPSADGSHGNALSAGDRAGLVMLRQQTVVAQSPLGSGASQMNQTTPGQPLKGPQGPRPGTQPRLCPVLTPDSPRASCPRAVPPPPLPAEHTAPMDPVWPEPLRTIQTCPKAQACGDRIKHVVCGAFSKLPTVQPALGCYQWPWALPTLPCVGQGGRTRHRLDYDFPCFP